MLKVVFSGTLRLRYAPGIGVISFKDSAKHFARFRTKSSSCARCFCERSLPKVINDRILVTRAGFCGCVCLV